MKFCDDCQAKYDAEQILATPVSGPADVLNHIADIRAESAEHVVALFLDSRNRVIGRSLIAKGGLRASVIQPRDIFREAFTFPAAAAIILAHNHPSNDVTPSREDIEVTKQLEKACEIMGLELLDHIVVSATRVSSLRELGHL